MANTPAADGHDSLAAFGFVAKGRTASGNPSRSLSRIRQQRPVLSEAMIWPNSSNVIAISEPTSLGSISHSTPNSRLQLEAALGSGHGDFVAPGQGCAQFAERQAGQPLGIVKPQFFPQPTNSLIAVFQVPSVEYVTCVPALLV